MATGLYYDYVEELMFLDLKNKQSEEKYDRIMNSNISILKIWISLFGEDIIIKPRANNIFYSKCQFHNNNDISVCIDENKKAFFCYGCNYGGTIVKLIGCVYSIYNDDVVDILYAYINDDINTLTKKQLEITKEIFKNYNSSLSDKYFEQSREKTKILNETIQNYLEIYGDSNDTRKKLVKRLCCHRKHLPKKHEFINSEELPF
ncbi:MAG: CHC2 zinc finger domain-containing protein [Bacilli bacterium]|nr:CHC2 zinc finger domain-containing protein [Bacilli bacterium]